MSYGFEIKNSNNQVILDNSDTTMRIMHIEYVAYTDCITGYWTNFTNTPYVFSVPDFDSTRGSYYVRAHATPCNFGFPTHGVAFSVAQVLDSVSNVNHNFASSSRQFAMSGTMHNPQLSWNNTTKQMTFTHPGAMNHAQSSTSILAYHFGNSEVVFLEWA